jgi:hypothetical protein
LRILSHNEEKLNENVIASYKVKWKSFETQLANKILNDEIGEKNNTKNIKKNDLGPPKLACKIYNLVMILG